MARLTMDVPHIWVFSACLGRTEVLSSRIRLANEWIPDGFAERRAEGFLLADALHECPPPQKLLILNCTSSGSMSRSPYLQYRARITLRIHGPSIVGSV